MVLGSSIIQNATKSIVCWPGPYFMHLSPPGWSCVAFWQVVCGNDPQVWSYPGRDKKFNRFSMMPVLSICTALMGQRMLRHTCRSYAVCWISTCVHHTATETAQSQFTIRTQVWPHCVAGNQSPYAYWYKHTGLVVLLKIQIFGPLKFR